MSLELILLTGLVALVALFGFIRPAYLFEYPVAASLLVGAFLIPQAWAIEKSGDFNDFEPTTTWRYMILCMCMTVVGYLVARRQTTPLAITNGGQFFERFHLNRLVYGATILVVIGMGALLLVNREAATMQQGQEWGGAIAFYVMIAGFLIYGCSLAWLLYLYSGNKPSLLLVLFCIGINLPAIIYAARREVIFTQGVILLLGLFFVKKKTINRLVVIPILLVGTLVINQAGAIRSYISQNDATIAGALTSSDVIKTTARDNYTELGGGVSDIAIATWDGGYLFFSPYLDMLVHLYVPAFILGREFKDSLTTGVVTSFLGREHYMFMGATRTGFADSFQSFHFFGCLVFFTIAYVMGWLWRRAAAGSVIHQFYYILMLAPGLKAFTESTGTFFGTIPVIVGSSALLFLYARKAKTRAVMAPLSAAR